MGGYFSLIQNLAGYGQVRMVDDALQKIDDLLAKLGKARTLRRADQRIILPSI